MAKQRYVGQMISGKALNDKKVPLGTVVRWEPASRPNWLGAPSMLTVKGWIRQDGTYAHSGGYRSSDKDWRILHVGNGKPTV